MMPNRPPTPYELSVRAFLKAHTEHIAGVKWKPFPPSGELQLAMDAEAARAFAEWKARQRSEQQRNNRGEK